MARNSVSPAARLQPWSQQPEVIFSATNSGVVPVVYNLTTFLSAGSCGAQWPNSGTPIWRTRDQPGNVPITGYVDPGGTVVVTSYDAGSFNPATNELTVGPGQTINIQLTSSGYGWPAFEMPSQAGCSNCDAIEATFVSRTQSDCQNWLGATVVMPCDSGTGNGYYLITAAIPFSPEDCQVIGTFVSCVPV